MQIFFVLVLYSAYAWYDGEQSFFATRSKTNNLITASIAPSSVLKIDLARNLELGPEMLWSDTGSAEMRKGFDLASGFSLLPKTKSWSHGEKEAAIYYKIQIDKVFLELTKPTFLACHPSSICKAHINTTDKWNITSPISKNAKQWEDLLSKFIPKPYFNEMPVQHFPYEPRSGMWSKYFKGLRIIISGTLNESNMIDSSFASFTAQFPLSANNQLLGIIGTVNHCTKTQKSLPEVSKNLIALKAKYCDSNGMEIFYHNF
ncbi:hypothetical protein DSO57_1018023 [Entomophthora muscae]|uniref:Uncharacterized protein n=1 Tax=Entomophthora muscae TaxID=34485 RepID=A0ACC2UDR4_9FUNG|nr:hypothetical protein DSO57_1018023 [Entomophthora muscae]